MRAEAARPAISPMARNGSRASPSCASTAPARPLAIRNSPGLPRATAMRSGKAEASRAPTPSSDRLRRPPSPVGRRVRSPPLPRGEGSGVRALAASPCASRLASSARCERSCRNASSRAARSTESPPSPRSVKTTAISLAILASPARAASTTIRASRGGSARREIARPSSVMRPSRSSAPIAVRSARASTSAARGGGSRKRSVAGSETPHNAQSSRKPERSAERISGAE